MTLLPSPAHPDRDVRQRDIIPPQRLQSCHALVIGVGAIGRQVALQLAAIGMPRLTLFDDDIVGEENLASQGYWVEDLGQPKVKTTATLCQRLYPDIEVNSMPERFKRSTLARRSATDDLLVFACVDSIVTRRLLWETLRARAALFVDGRMNAEVIRVLAVPAPASDDYYASTLFAAEEAFAGACTSRSTIYTASIAAGLMIGQMTRWLRGLPVDADLALNLLASELSVGPAR